MTNFKLNLSDFLATPQGHRATATLRRRGLAVEPFVAAIFHAVMEALPGLIPGGKYTTEDLIGPDLWVSFYGKEVPRCAGMCLSFLVETGAVPLVIATPPRRYPLKFRLP